MVAVRISRMSAEIAADEGEVAGVTRLDVQVAGDADGTTGESVRITRMAVEILSADPEIGSVSRLDVQVAADADQANGESVLISRMAVEILAAEDPAAGVTRLDVQVAADADGATGAAVRISRIVAEVLAREGSAGLVFPLAVADDSHIFLHNWIEGATLRTSYITDVQHSPATGSESRLGLCLKPRRTMDIEWLLADGEPVDNIERLEVILRRMTNARFQVPIYMDQRFLDQAYGPGDDVLNVDTTKARYFPGGRIVIVVRDGGTWASATRSFSYHLIESMTNNTITLASSLGITVPADAMVFPVMDCETMLEVEADYHSSRVPTLRMTVAEVAGDSALPPTKSDNPTGAGVFDERPIWFEEPNWASNVRKGRSRQGQRFRQGRADMVSTEGDRSRQTHEFDLLGDREAMWNALEFFDTRRGRLRTFWHVDQDQYMKGVAIDPAGTFVSIEPVGDIPDLEEESEFLGVVMLDGTVYVRGVTSVQDVVTVYRFAVTPDLPAALAINDVARIARARYTRFDSDEFEEHWLNDGWMETSIKFIEAINEENFETT